MKRLLAFILVFVCLQGVYAFSEGEVRVLSASEYVLQWKNDAARGMTYMVPTHWVETAAGERYKVFTEPTPYGEPGFRVCFVNKKANDDRSATRMKKNSTC